MAITHIATGPLQNSAADMLVEIPAGYQDGDFIVIASVSRSDDTITTPPGYEVLYTSTGNSAHCFFGKFASGTESDVSLDYAGSSRRVAQAAVFRGVKSGLVIDAVDGGASSAEGGSIFLSYPAITPSEDGCLVLMCGRWTQTSTSSLSSDPIAGFTELGDLHANQGGSQSLLFLFAYQIQTTATTISSGTWPIIGTPEANTQQSIALAIKPDLSGRKLKLLAHSSAASATGIAGAVFTAPSGSDIFGDKIGEFSGKTFESSLESGQAVLKVPVVDFGGTALTVSDTPVALVRNTTNTTGAISCTVIEE